MVSRPAPLDAGHDVSAFSCCERALDDWLKQRAVANQSTGASRTYMMCEGNAVVGYYALAVGAISHSEAPGRVKRNMPDPIPMMVIQAADIAGIRAIVVDAISDDAARFMSAGVSRVQPCCRCG